MPQHVSSVRLQLRYLIFIMIGVAAAVAAISLSLLYDAAFDEQKARLVEAAQSQARLIEAVARFDVSHVGADHPGGAAEATLSQVIEAHKKYKGFGKTGEFTLARRDAEQIIFLLSHRHYDLDTPKPVPWRGAWAVPMRRALQGLSGTVVGLDYRGVIVLAAHEPVAEIDAGIVAKIDLVEIRMPFFKAGATSIVGALIVLGLGIMLFRSAGAPLVARAQAEEALRAAKEQLSIAVESFSDGFSLFDANDRLVLVNSAMLKSIPAGVDKDIVGLTFDEILNNYVAADYYHSDSASHQRLIDERLRYFRSGEIFEYRTTQGEWFEVKEYETVDGGVAMVRNNISARKIAEERLSQLNVELEARVEARTQELQAAHLELLQKEKLTTLGLLTATVSHELRNPLGAIRTSAYLLQQKSEDDDPQVTAALERIERNILRCDSIIDELLDYTRVRPNEFQAVVLDDWLDGVLDDQIVADGVKVVRDFECAGALVLVDRDLLRRVVINLYDNALQAMTDMAGVEALAMRVLTVRSRLHGDDIDIAICDTGVGVADDDREKIFEPMFSTKSFGVGLGLAVVRKIVEQHEGTVDIRPNTDGPGTTVVLRLPLAVQH